ncbi:hypothetical protein LJR234_000312 [Mesorhizobium amorphae]|uniref:hypothetical protein n=1 Tax=Mesorhizobium amorphae TaxID=71433 RepID=UPI003ED05292
MLRVVLGAGLVAAWASSAVGQEIVDKSGLALPPKLLQAVVQAVAGVVKDPSSLQLRNLSRFTPVGADYEAVCGELNAKNGFGGYVGFQAFQFLPPSGAVTMIRECPS